MAQEPVDIVYTWVKGEDPDYRRMVAQYSGKPQHTNPERYRDQFDLLRYSLRSVEKNFPAYRYLYLVTMRPQLPEWLNRENPRLRVVHHDEFFPSAEFLPTFNHNTIESFFHLLPGISERFVYMNDDFFLGQPISLNDLFPAGKPIIYGSLLGEKWKFRICDGTWLSLGFIEHCPVPVLRSEWRAMQDLVSAEILVTQKEKFREAYHIRMDRLYTYYMLKYRRAHCSVSHFYKTRQKSAFVKIGNDAKAEAKKIQKLLHEPKKYFCLNDDQGENADLVVINMYREFLGHMFSEKSGYEI